MWFKSNKWTVDRLAEQMREMGIGEGDRLFVHTGLRKTKIARDVVPNLFAAYRKVLGPHGAVFFPTHTYSCRGAVGCPPFHPDLRCDASIGVWPELARKEPGVVRSASPTHSAAGIGEGAAEILAGHDEVQPVAEDSPLDRLQKAGAKVLLIGCGFESCTLLHLAEYYAAVPYLHLPCAGFEPIARVALPNGQVEERPIEIIPGCSTGFPKFEKPFRKAGLIRDGRIGKARAMLCEMQPLLSTAVELLRANPMGYLCDTYCATCSMRRERVGQEGL
ncbi:MAG: AAC(3) family N-acetyltransferase [Candidatus Hydrogenedentota bacterium]